MTSTAAIWILLLLAIAAANLPWLSQRVLFIWTPIRGKSPWARLGEWLLLYFLIGGIGMGLEKKSMGEIHSQDWEFYAITLCLFLVFALPGFIYRHDFLHHIERARKRTH